MQPFKGDSASPPSLMTDKKKPPEGGIFFEAEKITSSLQQVRLQERQQEQQREQQVLQQQVQEVFLFYRKRPKQQPTKLPRGVIFSWGFLKEWFEKFRGMPHASVNNLYMQPSRWTQAPSTQPLIIGEFPNSLSISFLSPFNCLAGVPIQIASILPKLTRGVH
jgi:hypothetical protein